jgi:hypothetical protein
MARRDLGAKRKRQRIGIKRKRKNMMTEAEA